MHLLKAVLWPNFLANHAVIVILRHLKFSASCKAFGVLLRVIFLPTSMRITDVLERMQIRFWVQSISLILLLAVMRPPSNREYMLSDIRTL